MKGPKLYYYSISSSDVPITATIKWRKKCSSALTWCTTYVQPCATTQEVQLRWFQYRILHRILTTNNFAYKLNIIENDLCTFCNGNKESIEHLLWECNIVQTFWNRFYTGYCKLVNTYLTYHILLNLYYLIVKKMLILILFLICYYF